MMICDILLLSPGTISRYLQLAMSPWAHDFDRNFDRWTHDIRAMDQGHELVRARGAAPSRVKITMEWMGQVSQSMVFTMEISAFPCFYSPCYHANPVVA